VWPQLTPYAYPTDQRSVSLLPWNMAKVLGHDTRRAMLKKKTVILDTVSISSVKIDCKVASRFAHTVMTSTALNKANVSQEVFFEVELPKTAFITNFSMEIDGQTYMGEIKEKEKAKEQYEKAVSSGQTAGLVKASGRKMEKFAVSVNIAANTSVTFTLTYEELLQRRFGKYEIMIRVKPKQLVQHFEVMKYKNCLKTAPSQTTAHP
uniref:VIT domain-containing protein n=1 Tax=Astyanax mexicanus TaxID=7994 RepID=W5LAP9_ASTMX